VSEQVRPVGVGGEIERLMVPLKLPKLVTLMVEDPLSPAFTVTESGLAATAKSGGSVMTIMAV
jgi:hypothetical protein